MKLFLIVSGLFFFWFFFHPRRSLLGLITFNVANQLYAFLLAVIRALLFGYIVYAMVAVYASFNRIATFSDILTILSSRPSQIGGPGIIGVLLGLLIAVVTYSSPISGGYTGPAVYQARVVFTRQPRRRLFDRLFAWVRWVASRLKSRRSDVDRWTGK